ncbi:activator protein [Streptomyces albus subsp. albus]|nr:activator protein [Streptomyces albus subsp. albus]
MRYEILGPLRVVDERGGSYVRAEKLAVVLAVLLIRAEKMVTAEQLMTEIWGERLPQRATAGIHVYISRLRKFLRRPGQSSPIVTRPGGYLLNTVSDEFDLELFQQLVTEGRKSARDGQHVEASVCFEQALGLWRGPVLGELRPGPITEGFLKWISEMRIECTELLVDSQLELGRYDELIDRLSPLVAEYPLREKFHWQLMLALHRCDRRDDALRTYESARSMLDRELGLEPGPKLRELHQAVLLSG